MIEFFLSCLTFTWRKKDKARDRSRQYLGGAGIIGLGPVSMCLSTRDLSVTQWQFYKGEMLGWAWLATLLGSTESIVPSWILHPGKYLLVVLSKIHGQLVLFFVFFSHLNTSHLTLCCGLMCIVCLISLSNTCTLPS